MEEPMKFQRALKLISYAVSALVFLAITAPTASAWTWVYKFQVYDGPCLCVKGDAGIDHRQPGVFSGNLAYNETYAFSQGCGSGLVLPSGWAAARLDVYKWTGSAWALCRGTNWQYGPTGISGGDVGGPYGPSQVFDYGGSPSCGAGYYGTFSFSYSGGGSGGGGGSGWAGL